MLDYASDSEATAYTPSLRSAGLSLPASTRRSLGLTNGRSNSLPRDFIRGRGGRKQGVRFDRRGGPDLTSSLAGRRALLLSAGIHSEDESDGAASAPEMPTPRRERGKNACRITSVCVLYVFLKMGKLKRGGFFFCFLLFSPSARVLHEEMRREF